VNKKFFIGIALAIISFSLVWTLLTPVIFPGVQAESATAAPYPGFMAPDFTLPTLEDETISLVDYGGQPVLVFLWASWCSVCKATMPGLQNVYLDFADRGFEILAVNTTFQDNLSTAVNYFQTQDYSYPFLLDQDGTVSRQYEVHALPTAILVGPDGIVLDVVIGSGMSAGFLRARLDQILEDVE